MSGEAANAQLSLAFFLYLVLFFLFFSPAIVYSNVSADL